MKKYDYMMKVASQALAASNKLLGNGETDWKKIYAQMEVDEAKYGSDVIYIDGIDDFDDFRGDGKGGEV